MKNSILINGLDRIDEAAARFLSMTKGYTVIALYGAMGAGKTTFTSAVCRQLGVREDAVSSPSFAIVNEYLTASGEPFYHFDFYRIESPAEALDIGVYDYFDSGFTCFVEWPENIEPLLPEDCLRVRMEVLPDGSRLLSWD